MGSKKREGVVVAVSGYFTILHRGHISNFEEEPECFIVNNEIINFDNFINNTPINKDNNNTEDLFIKFQILNR